MFTPLTAASFIRSPFREKRKRGEKSHCKMQLLAIIPTMVGRAEVGERLGRDSRSCWSGLDLGGSMSRASPLPHGAHITGGEDTIKQATKINTLTPQVLIMYMSKHGTRFTNKQTKNKKPSTNICNKHKITASSKYREL